MPKKGQYAGAPEEREVHRTIMHRMRERRLDLRLSQEELAELLTIPRPTLAGWERGRGYIPASLMLLISRKLEVPLERLFMTDEELEADKLGHVLARPSDSPERLLDERFAAMSDRLSRIELELDRLRLQVRRECADE